MAAFEDNGVIVSDDEVDDHTRDDSEEKDESNNSVANKEPKEKKSGARPKKAPQTPRTQDSRREDIVDNIRRGHCVISRHTQAFLEALLNPEDTRELKIKLLKNQLMMSENMSDVPPKFAKNWAMVVCPLGSRCLVISHRGYTGAYTKTGYHIISHTSCLPMGNKMFQGIGPCVLDCVYCNETETYYVLDVMVWEGRAVYDFDVVSRFKLLNDVIRDYDLSRPNPMNPYPLVPLKTFTPTKNNIHGAVTMAPYVIDGLIFYHKELRYTPGTTPLMLWLTLDRLPAKMKIEIPEMGIVTAVSYQNPISLALAHGVSPAIISQVYPGGGMNAGMNTRKNFKGQGQGQGQGRRGQMGQYQQPYSAPMYSQNQRYNQQNDMGSLAQGAAAMQQQLNEFAYLTEMMMNLQLQQSRYLGKNNNNSSEFYRSKSAGGRGRYQQPYQYMSKQEKKRRKGRSQSSNHNKISNWESPHGVMKSEWMETKPDTFEEDFLTCVCPVGKRRILVAANGHTCVYSKFGKIVNTFTSSLPSGSENLQGKSSEDLTVLDVIWSGSEQKFYVIDVMHWRTQPFYDAEGECRFFWLTDKLDGVAVSSKNKEYPIELLPKVASDKESICEALSSTEYKVDGLLSFEKTCKYLRSAGSSALWLKVDMMEELLGYPAPGDVSFKTTTEKERKARAFFMDKKHKEEETSDSKNEKASNSDDEEGSGDDDEA